MKPIDMLKTLLRSHDPQGCEIGPWLCSLKKDELAELAEALGTKATDLRKAGDKYDGDVARILNGRIKAIRATSRETKTAAAHAVATKAAALLGSSAFWIDGAASLDRELLFGDVLADKSTPWVGFLEPQCAEDECFAVSRDLLARIRDVIAKRRDVVEISLVEVRDSRGQLIVGCRSLRIRWAGGRGGYNLHADHLSAVDASNGVLSVELAQRPARVLPVEPPAPVLSVVNAYEDSPTVIVEAPPTIPVLDLGTLRAEAPAPVNDSTEAFARSTPGVFPVGARVLVTGYGERVAVVREHFPEGSTSYLFPHYVLRIDGQKVVVSCERVSVGPATITKPTRVASVARTSGKSAKICDECPEHVHARGKCPRHYDLLMKSLRQARTA